MISFDCTLPREGDFTLAAAFESADGLTALFGTSGSGKTTILRLIAGLEQPARGRIAVGDRVLVDTEKRLSVPVHKRAVGFVFQDGQLFPHMTVGQNLRYGSRFADGPAVVEFDRVVSLLGLETLLDRKPETLSGGERQRTAIGRALLAAPRILLMDEPLASLDMPRKLEILPFIERLRDEMKVPIIYVSHAVEEVARLASNVVRLERGRVAAQGRPSEVLAPRIGEAASRFEAVSMITATVSRHLPEFSVTVLDHPAGEIVLPSTTAHAKGTRVRFAAHATNVALALRRPSGMSVRTLLTGRVVEVTTGSTGAHGPHALVTVELTGGDRIYAFATRLALAELAITPGVPIYALIKAVSIDELGVSGPASI